MTNSPEDELKYVLQSDSDAILGGMARLLALIFAVSIHVSAQAPAPSTLALSLRTMNKALAACRESYTRPQVGTTTPILRSVLSASDYETDLKSRTRAEMFTSVLISHPEQVTGKVLVMIMSVSDDFTVGVGSTRAELFRAIAPSSDQPKAKTGW